KRLPQFASPVVAGQRIACITLRARRPIRQRYVLTTSCLRTGVTGAEVAIITIQPHPFHACATEWLADLRPVAHVSLVAHHYGVGTHMTGVTRVNRRTQAPIITVLVHHTPADKVSAGEGESPPAQLERYSGTHRVSACIEHRHCSIERVNDVYPL